MNADGSSLQDHPVVSREQWLSARTAFLAKEKEFTRLRDELSQQRRELPWLKVDKEYVFDGSEGKQTLAGLFAGRRQLVVYHFMFDPDWDEGCPHCSFWADSFNGIAVHLRHRDVSFVAVSRAPLAKLEPFKARMGWGFTWVSSAGTDFNYDYQASFTPDQLDSQIFNYGTLAPGREDREGLSVFAMSDDDRIFHTYATYGRGIDMVNGAYQFLDLVPKGRDEDRLEFTQAWVRHHDSYGD